MATTFLTTTLTTTQIVQTNDYYYITKQGAIFRAGSAAITSGSATATGEQIFVAGEVATSDSVGINLIGTQIASDTGSSGAHKVNILSGGMVTTTNTAIFLYGSYNRVTNAGDIFSNGTGVENTGAGLDFANTGTITGLVGVKLDGINFNLSGTTDVSTIINSGSIVGTNWGISSYGNSINLSNTGSILGGGLGVEINSGTAFAHIVMCGCSRFCKKIPDHYWCSIGTGRVSGLI
ncbi:MAG: hypothetical protein GXP03_14155, partial [Alphaproteobacteria bacterium]|nr:hypothetical protein [Alphaproteobacteria bacterium]